MSDSKTLPLSVRPIISYPRQMEMGKTYLMTINLEPSKDTYEWFYPEEEYPIYCIVDTNPLFKCKMVGDSAIVLHRFGGSYGAVKFLLTVAENPFDENELEGIIKINLINSYGVPIQSLSLSCSIFLKNIENSQKISEFFVDSYQIWYDQGGQLLNSDKLEEEIASYNQALQIKPDSYEEWTNRGIVMFHLSRLEEAIASYDQALQIKPDYYEAWYNRGNVLFHLSRLEEAIASYDQALQIKPDSHQAWNNRGIVMFHLSRLEEAIASYDQALQIKPDSHQAWNNRGTALEQLKRLEEAIASFDRVLQIKPDSHQAWNNRGTALLQLGRAEEAIASFDRVLQIKPDFHEAWNNRGSTQADLGNLEEAIASYDQALQIKPDSYEAWNNRGLALLQLGRAEEAIPSYDQALQIKPDFHEAWNNRGLATLISFQHDPQFQRNFALYFQMRLSQASLPMFLGETSLEIQTSLSSEVSQQIQKVAQQHFNLTHPELNQRGYEGQLCSLLFPLNHNIICQDTHPEGWGYMHHKIGKAHQDRGQKVAHPHSDWRKAANSYKTALKTLTITDYPELHLEVLQYLSNVLLALKEPEEARVLLQDGTDILNRMLADPNRGDYAKQQLARKFTAFNQLTVSLALQSGNIRDALVLAETVKNTRLRWIWNYGEIQELTYNQIRQLLTIPTTALIYWHLSPISLSTFLLLPEQPDPILISPSPQPDDREPALLQLLALEVWVKKWNEDYTPETQAKWYADLETQLNKLKTLLNIAEIEQHLQTHAIDHLILIPHRDLHRFPLPTFFPNQTCTILPSAYFGHSSLSQNWERSQERGLLIVENPRSTTKIGNTSKKLAGLPFAEIESALIQKLFTPLAPQSWEQKSKSPKFGELKGQIQCLPNTNATKNRVTEALKQPHQIFHFCGHSAYNPQNSALSCLYLSGEDTLTLKDILNLELQEYYLIVLSASETAITGNQTITDEYVGLVSGFLRAGATQVLSTLWMVESFSTTLLIVTFYQNLHSGQPPATALKNAQIWLRNATKTDLQKWLDDAIALLADDEPSQDILRAQQKLVKMENDRPYSHPYYWAAFTISGIS